MIRIVTDNELSFPLEGGRRTCSALLPRSPEGDAARRRGSPRPRRRRHLPTTATTSSKSPRRVDALGSSLGSEDGKNLLAGYSPRRQHPRRRGKEGRPEVRCAGDRGAAEAQIRKSALADAIIEGVDAAVAAKVNANDYHGAIAELATLRRARRCVLRGGAGQRYADPAVRASTGSTSSPSCADTMRTGGGLLESACRLITMQSLRTGCPRRTSRPWRWRPRAPGRAIAGRTNASAARGSAMSSSLRRACRQGW